MHFPRMVLNRRSAQDCRFRLAPALLAASVWLSAGCGGPAAPYTIVATGGNITYEDGTPIPASITVRFVPQFAPVNPREHPRPAIAEVDAAGNFTSLTTWKYDDGIIPGTHKVQILSPLGQPLPARMLAPEYADAVNTPLTIEVKGDGSPIQLRVPKP